MKPKLLLHSCCAPCSIYVLKKLSQDWEITIYFYDPNIHPRAEYNQRRDEIKGYAEKLNIEFIEGDYDTLNWMQRTRGLEKEPEKGKRCDVCFDVRLGEAARKAAQENYQAFASVLSMSPHKDAQQISKIGQRLAKKFQIDFLDQDWKKNDGFKIANTLSKKEGFYRQDYCGCFYSRKEKK